MGPDRSIAPCAREAFLLPAVFSQSGLLSISAMMALARFFRPELRHSGLDLSTCRYSESRVLPASRNLLTIAPKSSAS